MCVLPWHDGAGKTSVNEGPEKVRHPAPPSRPPPHCAVLKHVAFALVCVLLRCRHHRCTMLWALSVAPLLHLAIAASKASIVTRTHSTTGRALLVVRHRTSVVVLSLFISHDLLCVTIFHAHPAPSLVNPHLHPHSHVHDTTDDAVCKRTHHQEFRPRQTTTTSCCGTR